MHTVVFLLYLQFTQKYRNIKTIKQILIIQYIYQYA